MEKIDKLVIKLLVVFGMIVFLLPLMQQGMFVDGITYSAISNNLANGIGNYLTPHYSQTLYPQFHEHPPLVFIIQSLFFDVLGDGFLVERLYCLLTILMTMVGIVQLWNLFAETKVQKSKLWLPVLLWMTAPIVWWSYTNNILENTMGVFTLFAVYYSIKSLKSNNQFYMVWSSLCIVLAFLSKGPTGLFPLAIPFIYGVVNGFNTKVFKSILVLVGTTLIVSFCLYQFIPGLGDSMLAYLDRQLLPALSNEREITTSNRFSILGKLLLDISIMIIVSGIIVYGIKSNKFSYSKISKKNFIFFILVGLSASLPLIVVLKQRKFYLIPSIPFYALAFGFVIVENIESLLNNIKWKRYLLYNRLTSCLIGLVIIISLFSFGKYSRDSVLIRDVTAISKSIPRGSIISADQKMMREWSLIAYLSRIGYISLSSDIASDYILVEDEGDIVVPFGYSLMNVDLLKYKIYKKN